MFNTMYQMILLFVLLGGFWVPGARQVGGISMYTASEVEAVNGMDVKLKCTFRSSAPLSPHLTVQWSFRSLHSGPENIFFYLRRPYSATEGRFKDHVVWSGDVMKNDASITLLQVSPTFNGTYICSVLNPPDVHRRDAEVVLRVVSETAGFSLFDWFMTLFSGTGAEE